MVWGLSSDCLGQCVDFGGDRSLFKACEKSLHGFISPRSILEQFLEQVHKYIPIDSLHLIVFLFVQ